MFELHYDFYYCIDRANSEISYAKGLEKLANKLTKALDKMKLK